MNKISLKLDEANHLSFEFKVQGSSSEPGAGTPQFRFVVFEKNNNTGLGFIFPVTSKEADGTITVSIPAMKGTFKPEESYIGKVEVIIGTRLLVPTTLELVFKETLTVEVKPISNASTTTEKSLEDLLPELEELESTEQSPSTAIQPKENRKVTLTQTQLQAMLMERRKQNQQQASENKVKDSLKNLLKGALEED